MGAEGVIEPGRIHPLVSNGQTIVAAAGENSPARIITLAVKGLR
jgi:hypothetical protein